MDASAEGDEGLLAQAEDDDNASGFFNRRKAYLHKYSTSVRN